MESTNPSRIARALHAATLGAAVLSCGAPAGAQTAQEDCSARLGRARVQYEMQQFAEVERLIVDCVDRQALPAGEMDEGFRLLSLAYLRENLLADAQTTVIKHLAWSFTYEPDEVRDPPLYVALVRVTKAQLTVPPAALLASAAPTGAPAVPVSESVQPSSASDESAGAQPATGTGSQPAATDTQPASIASTSPAESTPEPAIDPTAQLESTTPARPAGRSEDTATDPLTRLESTTPAEPTGRSEDPTSDFLIRPEPRPAWPARRSEEPTTQPSGGAASDRVVEPSNGTDALAVRERAALEPRREEPERTASDNGVGLVGDAAESGAGSVTGGRYGGGLSAVPGTNPTALLIPLPSDARSDKEDPYNETLDFATVMPEIIGGPDAIRLEYPDFERRAGIEGRVVVRFVVDEAGDVSDAEVVRGVGPGLDAAALAALQRLRFTPARQNGQPARVRMTLTFRFQAPGRDSAG